jgi:hypothetical protein
LSGGRRFGGKLIQLAGFGPGGQLGDEVELAEELGDEPVGVLSLAELFDLLEDAGEGVFGLRDGDFRVVLTLSFEALVVLAKFLAIEIGETSTV